MLGPRSMSKDSVGHAGESREDHYEVVRPIGSGSFGQVFLVLHKKERKQYVMKSIELQSVPAEGREATKLEVRLLSTMRHPNIVAYRDSFINSAGFLCIMMEYCEHGDIFTFLQEVRSTQCAPEEAQLMEWFVQVTLALQALHQRKILHRDLKTQNIFLTGNRQQGSLALKLGDFGIAKVLSSTTDLAKTQIGTPFYMSPELINNKPYSYKSDIWGLGCVLYEIINGQRAFDAQSLNGLALKIIKAHYTPITSSCSQATKSLIKSMLSTNPTHRPTLKEMLHLSSIRPRILVAHRSVISASAPETRHAVEQALHEQLVDLGLGALINSSAPPKSDKKQLLQKLARAEERKRREEEVLQQTAAMLAKCLKETPQQPQQQPSLSRNPSKRGTSFDRQNSVNELQPASFDLSARGPYPSDDSQEETLLPAMAMSHRERSHRPPRERRKPDEAQLRFDEEVVRSRNEALARQRLRGADNRRGAEAAQDRSPFLAPKKSRTRSDDWAESGGLPDLIRQRAKTEDVVPYPLDDDLDSLPGRVTSVSWLLEAEPVRRPNAAPPMGPHSHRAYSGRKEVQLSPRRGNPNPPPFQCAEPAPPNAGPAPGSSYYGIRTSEGPFRPAQQARVPMHSVQLEAIPAPGLTSGADLRQTRTGASEQDSLSSGSISDLDELLASEANWSHDDDGVAKKKLQKRIDWCRAAIHRHRMTIEMLKNCYAQGDTEGLQTDRSARKTGMVQILEGQSPSPRHYGGVGRRASTAPAVVQDCAARIVRRCLEGLGTEKFLAARRVLQTAMESAELPTSIRRKMLEMLGMEKIGFLSLLDQLVHLERRWGMQDSAIAA